MRCRSSYCYRGPWPKWFMIVFACFVLFMGVLGCAVYYGADNMHSDNYIKIHGVVVGHNVMKRNNFRAGDAYGEVVEYVVDGVTYRVAAKTYNRPAAYDVGDKIVVWYNPSDPSEAVVDKSDYNYFVFGLCAIVTIVGFGMLIYSLFFYDRE